MTGIEIEEGKFNEKGKDVPISDECRVCRINDILRCIDLESKGEGIFVVEELFFDKDKLGIIIFKSNQKKRAMYLKY